MGDKIIKGYKGFDKDMKCRGFKFVEGEEYTTDKAVVCETGFHACEYPLDVFGYYEPANSVYHEVEQSGEIDRHDGDTKIASTKIKIGASISINAMIKAAIQFIYDRTDNKKEVNEDSSVASNSEDSSVASNSGYSSVASNSGYSSVASNSGDSSVASNSGESSVASNSGYRSVASNSGYRSVASNSGERSVASNSGDSSVASNSGYSSVASNSGDSSVALSWGIEGKVSGSIGTTLICAEWKYKKEKWEKVGAKLVEVDGKKIKADTFYTLKNGKFVEVK
jgi:hypothetical protein